MEEALGGGRPVKRFPSLVRCCFTGLVGGEEAAWFKLVSSVILSGSATMVSGLELVNMPNVTP